MLLESGLGKVQHFFRNICGIVISVRSFEIQDLGNEFSSTTGNLQNILGFIKFQHVAQSVEESLWSWIKCHVDWWHLVPFLLYLLVVWTLGYALVILLDFHLNCIYSFGYFFNYDLKCKRRNKSLNFLMRSNFNLFIWCN